MTLNRVAVKLELSWQGLRDFDSINLTADVRGERVSMVVRMTGKAVEDHDRRMVRTMYDEPKAACDCV